MNPKIYSNINNYIIIYTPNKRRAKAETGAPLKRRAKAENCVS
jgi:hypothetical protein